MDLSARTDFSLSELWLALHHDDRYRIADPNYWQARNLDWLLKPDEEGLDAPITRQCLAQLLETPIGRDFAKAWRPSDHGGCIESLGNLHDALIRLWCAHGLPVSPTIEAALNPNNQSLIKNPGEWAGLSHEVFEALAVKPIDLKSFLIQHRQPLPDVVFSGPEIAQINERIDRLFLPDYPAKTPEEKAQDQLWFDCWLKRNTLYIQLASIEQELNRIKSQIPEDLEQSKVKNETLARLQKEEAQTREEQEELEKAIKAIKSPDTVLTPMTEKDTSFKDNKKWNDAETMVIHHGQHDPVLQELADTIKDEMMKKGEKPTREIVVPLMMRDKRLPDKYRRLAHDSIRRRIKSGHW
jgi:hypothetical protein